MVNPPTQARKLRRRTARIAKAQRVAPRPLGLLRPIVRGQTLKYNSRVRAGKGFTFAELKAAGINPKEARGIGIAVDHRRINHSEESFQVNVARLKEYKRRLIVFPRNNRRMKKGDATPEERSQAVQIKDKDILPIVEKLPKIRSRKITQEERDTVVTAVLRKELTDSKLWGQREKRAREAAEK